MAGASTDPQIQDLQRQVAELSRKIDSPTSISRYLDVNSKKIISDAVNDVILDTVWNKYLYFHTYFESLDGWNLLETPHAGSSSITNQGVNLITGSTSGDSASISKAPKYSHKLTFDQDSRFRTAFTCDVTNAVFTFGVGDVVDPTQPYYGFIVSNGVLKGIVSNGSTETDITLNAAISSSNIYQVEARLFAGKRVDFYISNGSDDVLRSAGSIATTLPSGSMTNKFWIVYYVIATTAASKLATFDSFEYIQRVNPQSQPL